MTAYFQLEILGSLVRTLADMGALAGKTGNAKGPFRSKDTAETVPAF